jgi:hypothetical protein
MQATPPLGAALVTPLLMRDQLTVAAVAMTLIAGLPALYLVLTAADTEPAALRPPLHSGDSAAI